ncbi:ABC transporter substrate-binding protein [Paenibacillus riograndensis]|uniref:Family 1 extracellular solute-binding protein n=1 Tax=Paenibacillus riograndensis SBR5 TaxID=1073571 RepID=A0A0E4HEU9_9BACL|nr:extracellular solute-binding protein [Paenibacillus riograndensis]CQR56356.1 family 1 extracellular solute-binding protein [Paenibacillus riograndensis SBR5]
MQKKKWMRLQAVLLVLLAAILFLTACRDSGTGNSSVTAGGAGAHKEVHFSIAYAAGDPATKQAIAATIEAFMQAHPDIIIQDSSELSSSAYLDWLKIKDAVGEFPDLVEIRDTDAFASAGKIVELPSGLLELFGNLPQVNGKVWNAPLFVSAPQGIIYSKQAYARAGITRLPQTYGEFLDIQEKLKAGGMTPLVVGAKDIFHLGFWVNKFLIDEVYARDPDWNAKRTAKQVSFMDRNVVQAMTDFKELFLTDVNEGWLGTNDNQTASMLTSGNAAQLYSGTWMFSQIEEADPDFEYGFYALPDRRGKRNVVGLPSPTGWSLSAEAAKDTEKTEAIQEFIRFFFAPEPYSKFLASINGLPSTKEKVTYDTGEQMQEALKLMADPDVTKSLMINNWWGDNLIPPDFRNWFYKLLEEMILTDGDVSEYMKRADREYDRQVQDNQL